MSFPKLLLIFFILIICCVNKNKTTTTLEEKLSSKISHQIIDLTDGNSHSDTTFSTSFSVIDLNGNQIILDDYKGKVVLLNFWGTWCAPCIAEIPDFIELQKELSEDVQFIGVSTIPENRDKVIEFAKQKNVNYPLIIDDGYLTDKFYPQGWPSTYIISKTGKPVRLIIGATNKKLLLAELNLFL